MRPATGRQSGLAVYLFSVPVDGTATVIERCSGGLSAQTDTGCYATACYACVAPVEVARCAR